MLFFGLAVGLDADRLLHELFDPVVDLLHTAQPVSDSLTHGRVHLRVHAGNDSSISIRGGSTPTPF